MQPETHAAPERKSHFDRCIDFLMAEAHILDRQDYYAWLSLWRADGIYVVPATRDAAADPLNSLNYIYDNQDMRQRRVRRLQSGTALITSPATHTIRSLSRFILLETNDGLCHLSSSLVLVASRRAVQRLMAADVDHVIDLANSEPLLVRKTVTLVNADEPLTDISFIL
jgi:3-phenylpropionate/cinnamic acid dioxygenase small subunit